MSHTDMKEGSGKLLAQDPGQVLADTPTVSSECCLTQNIGMTSISLDKPLAHFCFL